MVADLQRALPVLTYHSIDGAGSPISTAPEEFRRQMGMLADSGWRTLTMHEMLAGHAAGAWPRRSLVITFDDGYRSVLDHAVPVMADRGFQAVVFIVSGSVGAVPRWHGQPAALRDVPLLGWSEIRRVLDAGCSIGAHSCTHPRLPALGPAAIEDEVSRPKREIEDRCGVSVEAFAYPYGARTPAVECITGRLYRAAFGTTLAFVNRRSRLTAFERVDAYYLRGAAWIDRLDGQAAASYLRIRRLGRAARAVLHRDVY